MRTRENFVTRARFGDRPTAPQHRSATPTSRRRRAVAVVGTLLLAAGLAGVAPVLPVPVAAAAESLSVTKTTDGNVLVGTETEVTIAVTNNGTDPEYNLAVRDQLPAGVVYVPGSTSPAGLGEPRVVTTGTAPDTRQTLVWNNVSDLPVGARQAVTFRVTPASADYPVGARFDNVGDAYANADPRTLVRFDAVGAPSAFSIAGSSAVAETDVSAIKVVKTEPSPERELRRGIHTHDTVYTLTVTNNDIASTTGVVLVDLLPAQLEFLGCGTVDNSATEEYPGSGRLDATSAELAADCPAPRSVTTVADPAGVPAGVYTRVEWALGDLAPSQVVTVRYAAGIPQRANTMDFGGATPTGTSLVQTANLDNNTGPSTKETLDEQVLTNHARVSGIYTGPLAPGTSPQVVDATTASVTAEDLAMQKSVAPSVFTHGGIATYTLQLQVGEYTDAADIVVTDVLPSGLCPLAGPGTNYASGAPADCAGATATAPSLPFQDVVENTDGTFTVTFAPIDEIPASGTLTITYQARMLATYRAGGASSVPTVVGDDFTNTVALAGTVTTLPDVAAPAGDSGSRQVRDDSAATLVSSGMELSKRILPQPAPYTAGTYACPTADASGYVDSAPLLAGTAADRASVTFTKGSRVCFLLEVRFPAGNDTKDPVLTDFLPQDVALDPSFDGDGVAPVAGNTVPAGQVDFDPSTGTFTLGAAGGSGRFVEPGAVLRYAIAGTVTDVAPGTTAPDVPGNLAKLRWTNTEGTVGFLRDQEDLLVPTVPPVGIDKSAPVTSVRAGTVVPFTVTVRNDGAAANGNDQDIVAPRVRDVLPAGIPCSAVSAIAGPAGSSTACTGAGTTADPAVVTWTTPRAVRIAAGTSLAAFTYTVTYPSSVAAGASYVNTAQVTGFEVETNVDTFTSHTSTVQDTHQVVVPSAAVAKTQDTNLDPDTQDPTQRSSGAAAVIGEQVRYVVTTTLPASTTVYNGVFSDAVSAGLRVDSVVVEHTADASDASGWTTTLPTGTTTSTTSPLSVTLPATYAVDQTPDGLRMTVLATVIDRAATVHGTAITNRGQFRSTGQFGAANPVISSPQTSLTVVEPVPAPTKRVDDSTPVAGQTVTYVVTARNVGSPTTTLRPTLYDARLVDCVPAGIAVQPGSLVVSPAGTGTATVGAPGTSGCATGATPITWEGFDLPWRNPAAGGAAWPTLAYQAVVTPSAGGGATYTNTVTQTGSSRDGAPATGVERDYSGTTSQPVTVPGGLLTKSTSTPRVPVGDRAAYVIEVDLPADVNFYDAIIADTLPTGMDPASVQLGTPTCRFADAAGGPCATGLGAALGPVGQQHGWSLGDVASSPRPRTLVVPYTAVVTTSEPTNVAGASRTNTASLRWFDSDQPGSDLGSTFPRSSGPGSAVVTVTEPRVTIEKSVDASTVLPGETFTYTVRVTNATGVNVSTAHDVDVTDTVPAGVVVVASSISGGGVLSGGTSGGGTITWSDLGPLAPGASAQLTYQARLTSPAPTGVQTNTADVTAYTSLDGGGRTYDGPEDSADVAPALPSLDVVKTAPSGSVAYRGQPTTWQVTVTNDGAAPAYDVDVVDTLPVDWSYTATTAVTLAGAAVTPVPSPALSGSGDRTLTWSDLGDLQVGQSLVLTFTATPSSSAATGGTVAHVNQVTASADDLEDGGSPVTTDSDDETVRILAADLAIEKLAVGTPVAGEDFSWTLRVSNQGPDPATGPFLLTDTLPEGTSYVGASDPAGGLDWSCGAVGRRVTCTLPAGTTLAVGASLPVLTLTAAVPATVLDGTDLLNEATVSAATHDPDPSDNEDDVTVAVDAISDMGVVKQLNGSLVAGRDATYTIDVTNHGPSVSQGEITVTDTLPAGLSYVSHAGQGWTLSRTGQDLTFTWTGARPVAVGALPQITVTVAVDAARTAAVVNTATVAEPTDPTSGPEEPDTSTVTTTPQRAADLGVEKESLGDFTAGTQDVYRFTVTSFGPSDVLAADAAIRLTDTLPAGVTYVGIADGAGWSCAVAAGVLECSYDGALAVGDDLVLEIDVAIASGATGDIENTAVVDGPLPDPDTPNNTGTDNTGIDVRSDLAIEKTLATSPVVAGGSATYELDVENRGPSATPGPITVDETLPAGLTIATVGGTGWSCTVAGDRGSAQCTRAAGLGVGDAAPSITVVADVASGLGTVTLTNVASVDGPATDPTPSNNTDEASTPVTEDTELTIVKQLTSASPAVAGTDATFSVVLTNTGTSDARGVRVEDTLPVGMTLVSVSGPGWTCEEDACTRDRIVAGTSAPALTVVARIASSTTAASLTNVVDVVTVTPGDDPADSQDDAVVPVARDADLSLVKDADEATVVAGRTTSYTVRVANAGPSDAAGPLTVTDTLPEGLTFLAAADPWTCAPGPDPRVVACMLPTGLPVGQSAPPLRITVAVDAAVAGSTLTNTAVVSSPTPDSNPANDGDDASVAVVGEADVSIVKSHDGVAKVGEQLTYTLQVRNDGPSEARGVVVEDALPAGLAPVAASGPGWTCTEVAGLVSCALDGALAPGSDAAPITVVVEVLPAAYPEVANTAEVTTSTADPDPSDNTSTDTVPVPALVDLAIDKSLESDLVVGEEATYGLLVTNAGPTAAPGPITVADVLPVGLTYVAGEGDGWTCEEVEGIVTCVREDALEVGASSEITLTVAVGPAAYPTVLNRADVSSPAEEVPDGLPNTSEVSGPVTPTVDLTIDKSVQTREGDRVVYRLEVTNGGPSATVAPVVVRDPMPRGLEARSASGDGWSCAVAPRLVECTFAGELAAGDSAAVLLTAELGDDAGSEVRNVAEVQGGGDPGQGTDDATITVTPAPVPAPGGGGAHLPDTGGPRLALLGLAVLLLVGGGGLLTAARRRSQRS